MMNTTYLLEWLKSWTVMTLNAGEDVEQWALSFIDDENAMWRMQCGECKEENANVAAHIGRQRGGFLQN